jgi:hypothetical protein
MAKRLRHLRTLGRFELKVEGEGGDTVRLKIYSDGKLVYNEYQVLPGPATIRLPD